MERFRVPLTLQHLVLTILQIYMARIICVLVVLLRIARIASTGSDYAAKQNEFRRLHQADDVKRNNDMEKVAQASISSTNIMEISFYRP